VGAERIIRGISMSDFFDEILKGKNSKEPTREDRLKNLRFLEQELKDLRKEVYELRRELGVE
jgi:hypothetical protein